MKTALLALAALAALPAHADESLRSQALSLFGALQVPSPGSISTPEAQLGRALFWDPRVSADGKTACASCHLDHGSDRRPFSQDARGKATSRHSQTVFNAMSQSALRWLGDRKTGADQAEGSLTGSLGFASKADAVKKLAELEYGARFKAVYSTEPEPLSSANYGRALEAYQATLVTPSAFDRFLGGNDDALTAAQKKGLRDFIATGCAGCHSGPLLGGRMNSKFGVIRDYWLDTGSDNRDPGRYSLARKEEERNVFRVPMLRNIAKTAPYFHDGSVATLDRAVRVMASSQLGRTLDDATVASIVAFLESLSGDTPPHYRPPSLHPSIAER